LGYSQKVHIRKALKIYFAVNKKDQTVGLWKKIFRRSLITLINIGLLGSHYKFNSFQDNYFNWPKRLMKNVLKMYNNFFDLKLFS